MEESDNDRQTVAELEASYYIEQLKPVLHRDETKNVDFVPVYVSTVSNPKTLSTLISYLASRFPLDELSHLKRIRKLQNEDGKFCTEILIGTVSAVDKAPTENRTNLNTQFELVLREYQVPKDEPLMRSQYEEWTKFWPIVLKAHVPSTPPALQSFSPAQIQLFVTSMRKLIPLAHNAGNACLILDSAGNELALACHSDQSPLSHCCINVINLVADKQLSLHQDISISHHKRSSSDTPSEPKPTEYLCTNGTAIVVREPCIMCSMALLHSRIACVIYAIPNPSQGGLGSRFSIHCESRLNHHFHVYKGFLEDEVRAHEERNSTRIGTHQS